MGGQPMLACPDDKFKRIMNRSEKVFYGRNTQFSWKACRWIECQSGIIGRHINHALFGHGGKRCMVINWQEIMVEGFDSKTSTVYQFYGFKWHGCPCLGTANDRYCRTMNNESRETNPRPRIPWGFGLGMLPPITVNKRIGQRIYFLSAQHHLQFRSGASKEEFECDF